MWSDGKIHGTFSESGNELIKNSQKRCSVAFLREKNSSKYARTRSGQLRKQSVITKNWLTFCWSSKRLRAVRPLRNYRNQFLTAPIFPTRQSDRPRSLGVRLRGIAMVAIRRLLKSAVNVVEILMSRWQGATAATSS